MTLTIAVISDASSWMWPYIEELAAHWRREGHAVHITDAPSYDSADVTFFLSYQRIVSAEVLGRARNNLVVHGSALPEGRGWSPWSWQILEGRNQLVLSLLEAAEDVDSGPIYDQRYVELEGHELIREWQARQAEATIAMCADFITDYPSSLDRARPQEGTASYYQRRRPQDSRIDPERRLAEQFELFRIVDNERYPAFFDLRGHRYLLRIERQGESAIAAPEQSGSHAENRDGKSI